jgi:hypothetical protein
VLQRHSIALATLQGGEAAFHLLPHHATSWCITALFLLPRCSALQRTTGVGNLGPKPNWKLLQKMLKKAEKRDEKNKPKPFCKPTKVSLKAILAATKTGRESGLRTRAGAGRAVALC